MEFALEALFADIGTVTATFSATDQRRIGRDRGGALHPTAYGSALWRGTFTVQAMRHRASEVVEARMERLLQADSAFLVCPPGRLSAASTTGQITSISTTDRREVTLSGADGLAEGGWLGVAYDGGRLGLHRVLARAGTAVTLASPLAMAVPVGTAVTLGRPAIRAVVDAGGYDAPTYRAVVAEGISVAWTQTLRRPA